MKKAIFLDRDGVLNKTIFRDGKPRAPYTLDDFELFEGVKDATQKLKAAGFILIVVTNQPDVARGWVSLESVKLMNHQIQSLLPIDDLKVCFHVEKDQCLCRKPKPGMLLEAASEWSIDLTQSYMIGDRYSDVAAGVSAGCTSILIGDGDERGQFPDAVQKFPSLYAAALWILKN
jgi:D-glycero-D-manno-heptose 1,7-bisphosphate phosphatase